MANETRTDSDYASPVALAIMTIFYIVVFLTSELGNGFVVFSLLVRRRRRSTDRKAVDDFVLSLAITDFLFTTLSLFNGVEYILGEWKLGVVACKIQSQFVEVTYTVSTLTLATISYSRFKAANSANPFELIRKKPKVKRNIAFVWLASFVFSLPLVHGYTVVWRDGSLYCTNKNFDELTRQMYYFFQAVLLFFVPMTIMIVTQRKITSGLRSYSEWSIPQLQAVTPKLQATTPELEATTPKLQATTPKLQATTPELQTTTSELQTTTSELQATTPKLQASTLGLQATTPKLQATTPKLQATTPKLQTTTLVLQATTPPFSTRAAISERRITKLLMRVWLIFSCCWTPFIMYRTLDYFMHIREKSEMWNQLWHLCQLLLLLNSAINPFLYYRITMKGFGGRTKARCVAGWWYCIHRLRDPTTESVTEFHGSEQHGTSNVDQVTERHSL